MTWRCTRNVGASLVPALMMIAVSAQPAAAGNWTRFLGENGTGISDQKGIPTSWSDGDYSWNVELPGVGHSSPVIWGEKLFVTSATDEGAVRYLICLDAKTGRQNWIRHAGMSRSRKHEFSSWASATPTVDAERVYVLFADKEDYAAAAYDHDGKLLWRRTLGCFESQHGQGVSPILFEDLLIVPNDQDGPSSIIALDRRTGETVWSTLRMIREASYATPFVLQAKEQPAQLICSSGAMGITSVDPRTGKLNWFSGEFPLRTVSCPAYCEASGLIYQSCGGGGKGKLLIGVDSTGEGDVSNTHVKYRRDRVLPYVPAPIAYQGHLYLWNDDGVVSCVETKTGRNVWTRRVGGGTYFGSPVCVDGKLYIMSEQGEVVVVAASPNFKLYGKMPLGDYSHATPAVAHGRLYLRTFHRLACLEARDEALSK